MFHYSCQNSSGSGVERQSEREWAGKKTRKMLFKIQEFTLTQSVYTRSKQKYFISRTLHSWLALVMPYRLWFNHFRSHTKRFRNKSKTEISEMNTYRWVVGMVCVCVCVLYVQNSATMKMQLHIRLLFCRPQAMVTTLIEKTHILYLAFWSL